MEKYEGMELGEMRYKKTNVAEDIWRQTTSRSMTCPQCKGFLTVVQVEPIYDPDNAYTPYRTIVECSTCSFRMVTESFTILGGIKDFDTEFVEIGSWGPSGCRVLSRFKHSISATLLSELKKSQELVEFLIVNEHVVQVIG
ncbi:MAG: hypothetical protein JW840_07970 [Candidatus Thermoplasmatota archaeon]|nr:hypothetical protein [Candidatus Thermoplasmatota archaeon]